MLQCVVVAVDTGGGGWCCCGRVVNVVVDWWHAGGQCHCPLVNSGMMVTADVNMDTLVVVAGIVLWNVSVCESKSDEN